jgi:glutathione peroxidase-family protein
VTKWADEKFGARFAIFDKIKVKGTRRELLIWLPLALSLPRVPSLPPILPFLWPPITLVTAGSDAHPIYKYFKTIFKKCEPNWNFSEKVLSFSLFRHHP